MPPTVIRKSIRWPVAADPPTEVEILREIRVSGRHKAPGPDELSPPLIKDEELELVIELQGLVFRKCSILERDVGIDVCPYL